MSVSPHNDSECEDHLDPICACANLPPYSLDALICSISHLNAGDAVDAFLVYKEGTFWTFILLY